MLYKTITKYRALPLQVRASFWFLLCAFLQKGISVITTPIVTRLLSTSEYGQYSVFNSWLSIVTVFVTLHLYHGVYAQGLVKFKDCKYEFSSSLQGLTLTLVLLWTLIYLAFMDFWNGLLSLTTVQVLAMFAMIWATAVFGFWSMEQRTELKYRSLVAITLLASLAKPLLGILFVLNAENKATAYILGLAIAELLAFTCLFFLQMKKGKQFFSAQFWKYVLVFNIPLIPHYLSMSVLSGADRIMIERMVGSDAAGIYGLAYSVALIMTLFNTALMQTLEPWLYKKINRRQTGDIAKVAYPAFILIAGVNLLLIALAPEIIAVFAPAEYYAAIWIVPPVAMSAFFMFTYAFFATFEFYYEKRLYIALSTVGGAILNIALNYIFIGMFGYLAAGYTTLACYIVYAVLHYCFMKRICTEYLNDAKIYSTKALLGISLAFVGTGFILLSTYSNMFVRYAAIIVAAVILIVKRRYFIGAVKGLIRIKQER